MMRMMATLLLVCISQIYWKIHSTKFEWIAAALCLKVFFSLKGEMLSVQERFHLQDKAGTSCEGRQVVEYLNQRLGQVRN